MELHQWLDHPENDGRATWLAGQLGLTKGAVSIWRTQGVPMKHMAQIVALCPGVSQDAMLRHALRCKSSPVEASA